MSLRKPLMSLHHRSTQSIVSSVWMVCPGVAELISFRRRLSVLILRSYGRLRTEQLVEPAYCSMTPARRQISYTTCIITTISVYALVYIFMPSWNVTLETATYILGVCRLALVLCNFGQSKNIRMTLSTIAYVIVRVVWRTVVRNNLE